MCPHIEKLEASCIHGEKAASLPSNTPGVGGTAVRASERGASQSLQAGSASGWLSAGLGFFPQHISMALTNWGGVLLLPESVQLLEVTDQSQEPRALANLGMPEF